MKVEQRSFEGNVLLQDLTPPLNTECDDASEIAAIHQRTAIVIV